MKIMSKAGLVLHEDEHETLLESLPAAVAAGAYLRGAYLDGAYLDGAYLDGANLRGAYLDGANLRGANLRGANLRGANLRGANLRGAYLRGANLRGAYLDGANLRGAKINWQSHDLIAELLFRAAGQNIEKRKVAGAILISRDWCWDKFIAVGDPLTDWAIETLAEYAKDDQLAPAYIRRRIQQHAPATQAPDSAIEPASTRDNPEAVDGRAA